MPYAFPDYESGHHPGLGFLAIPFGAIVLMHIGVFQLLYMVPAYVWTFRRGTTNEYRKGLLLSAIALYLLNAGCLGLISGG